MAIRNSVARFAEAMEAVLQENDHKGGWENCSNDYLLRRMQEELDELRSAVSSGDSESIQRECCDLANFAHMLHDITAKAGVRIR